MNGLKAFELPLENSVDVEKAKEVVERPLKKEWIKQRSAGQGRMLDYIEGGRVKKLLLEAFDHKYSWEIIHWEIIQSSDRVFKNGDSIPQPPYCLVHGRLSVPGLGVREGFGSKVVQFSEGAEQQSQALKSAATDALKVAASSFGIALDLYLDDVEFEEERDQPRKHIAKKYQKAPVQRPVEKPQSVWMQDDLDKLKDLKALMNIVDNSDLDKFVKDFSAGRLQSYKDISPDNIKAFNKYLESKVQG